MKVGDKYLSTAGNVVRILSVEEENNFITFEYVLSKAFYGTSIKHFNVDYKPLINFKTICTDILNE